MPLKYLFIARFADGHEIRQTPEDVSPVDPLKSQFYDVCQYEEISRLVTFTLVGKGSTYTVNLEDGSFTVNGMSFFMHEEEFADFRVVFYRTHTHDFKVGSEKNEELDHRVAYCLGWQTTLAGKNYKRIMKLN